MQNTVLRRVCSIISNARIKDSWSASWLNVESLFRYGRNVMACKNVNRLLPESLWMNTNQDIFTRGTGKISRSLDIGLNLPKKAFITQLSYNGMIHLPKFVT